MISPPLRMPPIAFAHRGARAHAPENTLEAFALALRLGATGLESDAWITADGELVLDHDGEFEERAICEMRRAELPDHIPTLGELYDHCGCDYELSLDIKDAAAAPGVIEVAHSSGDPERIWLCHWNWKVVAPWRALSRAVRLVDSTQVRHTKTPPTDRARRMLELGIDALNLHRGDWTAELVRAMHSSRRFAFAWDLQETCHFEPVLKLGVDAVYSDHVDRMMEAVG